MSRRQKSLAAVAFLAVTAVAGTWLCSYLLRPPARVLFDGIELGMRVDEVDGLVPDDPTSFPIKQWGWLVWQGRIDGQVHHASCDITSGLDPDSVVTRSGCFQKNDWKTVEIKAGVHVAVDPSGQTRLKAWQWASGMTGVIYDDEGRAIEKLLVAPNSLWREHLRQWWNPRRVNAAPPTAPPTAPAPGPL